MIIVFHALIIVLGVLSMGYQLLASRLLSPHFGSSIIVWAWLISTFLAAFSLGSIIGGRITRLGVRRRLRMQITSAAIGLLFLGVSAIWGFSIADHIAITFTSMNVGLFLTNLVLFFVPVAVLSSFSPQCVHYLATRGMPAGSASGIVYGVSTIGNIAGVMLTTFVLIPHFPVSKLMLGWLIVGIVGVTLLISMIKSAPGPIE